MTHDENNGVSNASIFYNLYRRIWLILRSTVLHLDDTVIIRHTSPISARKRFVLEKILRSPTGEAVAAKAGLMAGTVQRTQTATDGTTEAGGTDS